MMEWGEYYNKMHEPTLNYMKALAENSEDAKIYMSHLCALTTAALFRVCENQEEAEKLIIIFTEALKARHQEIAEKFYENRKKEQK